MSEFTDPSGRRMIRCIDLIGQPLSLGDHVAFPNGSGSPNSMRIGEVIRMGEKMVVLSVVRDHRGHNGGQYRRYFADVVKVPNV